MTDRRQDGVRRKLGEVRIEQEAERLAEAARIRDQVVDDQNDQKDEQAGHEDRHGTLDAAFDATRRNADRQLLSDNHDRYTSEATILANPPNSGWLAITRFTI